MYTSDYGTTVYGGKSHNGGGPKSKPSMTFSPDRLSSPNKSPIMSP